MSGYALDMKPNGFGLIGIACDISAVYADPITDNLYLVLTDDNEPASAYLPLPSTAPVPDGVTIYQFDGDDASKMVTLWRGKLNLLPRPATPQVCQVRCEDYENIMVRGYGDGALHFEQVLTGEMEFTLPTLDEFTTYEIELLGTSRVRTVDVAETVEELG